jgi:Mor family transcriptional regulator
VSGNGRLAACVAEAYSKPRKPPTPPFGSIEQEAIYDSYIDGDTMKSIAELYQCSTNKVSKAIHRQHRKEPRRTS